MAFHLREYRKEDFDRLWAIDQACFPPGISYSRFELMSYIKRRKAFTVVAEHLAERAEGQTPGLDAILQMAEAVASEVSKHGAPRKSAAPPEISKPERGLAGAAIVGFIVAESGRQAGHIITIDVLEQARGAGLGSRLLAAAEEQLRHAGCHAVYLETAVDNQVALAFYKHHGYFLLKTIPRYYSNGVDAFVLKKDLLPDAVPG